MINALNAQMLQRTQDRNFLKLKLDAILEPEAREAIAKEAIEYMERPGVSPHPVPLFSQRLSKHHVPAGSQERQAPALAPVCLTHGTARVA